MIKIFFLLAPLLWNSQTDDHTQLRIRLREHVSFLATDSLGGRLIGTEGNLIAGEYIADCFAGIGLEEYNGSSYFHYFDVKVPSAMQDIPMALVEGCNVIGVLPGKHPYLKNEYILVGAHYDHLGTAQGRVGVMDSIYNGADDNASGTAVLIELAALLKERGGLARTVVFVAFDGEEQGLLGSQKFMEDNLLAKEQIVAMITLDMVGYYRKSGVLKVLGTGTLKDARKWMPPAKDLKVRFIPYEWSPVTATDTRSFATKEIPTLFFTTGLVSPYHKVNDHAELIDYDGLAGVAAYTAEVTATMAEYAFLSSSGKFALIHHVPDVSFHMVPAVQAGTNRWIPTRGALQGKPAFYMAAGADFRLLWRGFLELGPGLYLENIQSYYALNTGGNDRNRINAWALNVPLTIRAYFPEFNKVPLGVYLSYQLFYRHYLDTRARGTDMNYPSLMRNHEGGVGIGFGLRASVFQIGYETKWGLTGLLRKNDFDNYNVKNLTHTFVFSYYF